MPLFPYVVNNDTFPNVRASINAGFDAHANYDGFDGFYNGQFMSWTLGTSFTTTPGSGLGAGWTADGWYYLGWNTSPVVTISRQAFALGTSELGGTNPTFFMRLSNAGTGGANQNQWWFAHRLPSVGLFSGRRATVTFWARSTYAKTIALRLYQSSGTSGQSRFTGSLGRFTLNTTWTRYSVSFDVPSVAGWTLGTATVQTWDFMIYMQAASSIPVTNGTAINWEGTGDTDFAEFTLDLGDYGRRPTESGHPSWAASQFQSVEYNFVQQRRMIFGQPVTAGQSYLVFVPLSRMRIPIDSPGPSNTITITESIISNPNNIAISLTGRAGTGVWYTLVPPVSGLVSLNWIVTARANF